MVHNAEETTGPQFAVRDDPRVTRVGRVLRRTRLDELPQAWNVLKGEMSLVGPRPERPEFVASLETRIPFYRTRLIARPGVTGWAQVNLSALESSDDPVAKLEYDLYYIQHRTLLFDLRIMLRTLRTILRLEGN
jgi:lipopolysaccharide/colanic/teichoic acid biosynthesis glycosyltransferase